MARGSQYTYDPKTGEWKKSKTTKTNTKNDSTTTHNKNDGDNLTSTTSDKDDSKGSVEQKYNYIEINTLSGTLSFIVTKETIKIKAGDTVRLKGLGKHLSGKYYIKDVTRQIGSNGYAHSATAIKTDFGNSLKTKSKITKKKTKKKKKKVSSTQTSKSAKRTYTVKAGDCLWNIAVKYYGNGALYTKIYDANTNKIANPNLIYPGQVFVIP